MNPADRDPARGDVGPRGPDPGFELTDLGDRRVLRVGGREYVAPYSLRVLRMLIARKGVERAPLYLAFKDERAPHYLGPLMRHLRTLRRGGLRTLEVGCSFGHMTEYLQEQPEVAEILTFDTDPRFVDMARAKAEDLALDKVREVALFTGEATCRLPYRAGEFDLVVACGVVEHLPRRFRRAQVDEYYRVLGRGGHVAILDTPNRLFPIETHSVGLPLVQWLPPRLAWAYARALRPGKFRSETFEGFTQDGTGWQNATLAECLPSTGWIGLEDVTEAAGYGWRFFRDTARSRARRALLPLFAAAVAAARALGHPPSVCLPYLNLLLRKT